MGRGVAKRTLGPRTRIRRAAERVEARISQHNGSLYARGLSREGYLGGYAQALSDVQLVLDGIIPSTQGFWHDADDG